MTHKKLKVKALKKPKVKKEYLRLVKELDKDAAQKMINVLTHKVFHSRIETTLSVILLLLLTINIIG